ncbi:MAG: transcriptional regulator [Candidatus Moranbacteria bacterium CG23_combo_of_CG06-09_8_20_14_all_35_22]|nr:MAG: transcriptional regulator [Candidatus Moranbacteria bacterium CG23_combo_of_CG06-09_8_20_14_all_35_22]
MLNFSTKGEYGLRAMVNLAHNYPQIRNIKKISNEEKISTKYLERLISDLRKNNLVKSIKGKNGGYVLAKKPKEISAGEIIEIMEGPMTAKCQGIHCSAMKKCPSSFVWIKLGEQIRKTLYGIRLSDLIHPIK